MYLRYIFISALHSDSLREEFYFVWRQNENIRKNMRVIVTNPGKIGTVQVNMKAENEMDTSYKNHTIPGRHSAELMVKKQGRGCGSFMVAPQDTLGTEYYMFTHNFGHGRENRWVPTKS